jgi:tetratricopeptide (TPR) repeat protein
MAPSNLRRSNLRGGNLRVLRRSLGAVALAAATFAAPLAARADVIGDVGVSLSKIESQAIDLEQTIRAPSEMRRTDDVPRRRLIEAQVAYGVGNYSDASILLYDVVEHYPSSSAYHEAVFYLADALYLKGDSLTARKYFNVIVTTFGDADTNYGKSIERLLELSLKLQDDQGVPELLARLDRIPAARQLPSAPYVRGKFAYFRGQVDDAIKIFGAIDEGNPYYFQARYFLGAAYIAKDELASAAKVYYDMLKVPAKDPKQRRIVELAHMALGRIHYHRDQPTEAIEQYLQVSRKSDLFDDALYEVAFVYVKSKQFDKALRALELLEMATGGSCAHENARVNTVALMPEVCILKGNLGIRKAQSFVDDGKGNPVEEYTTALAIFENTRSSYEGPKGELEKIVAANDDPKKYFATVTQDKTFESDVTIPSIARKWIREEPEVARVVNVTKDLTQIHSDLADAEVMITRLDRVVSSPNRVNIFPSLADKRAKVYDLLDHLFALRIQVATAERALIAKYSSGQEKAELDALAARREQLSRELDAMTGPENYEARIARARNQYEELDKRAQEVEVTITSLEAELVALEKYYKDTKDQPGKRMDQAIFDQSVKEIRDAVTELRTELDNLRKDLIVAKDEAGVGDDLADDQRRLRAEIKQVASQEHEAAGRIKARMDAGDAARFDQLSGLIDKMGSVEATITRVNAKIDKILDSELAEVRIEIDQEKKDVADAKILLAKYEDENQTLGSEVIAGSFGTVAKKFYEITVRAEVGIIDVSWAQKEESEDNYNRIEIDSAREKKVLENEFSEVSQEPAAPAKEKPPAQPGAAPSETPPPAGSPAPEGGNAP